MYPYQYSLARDIVCAVRRRSLYALFAVAASSVPGVAQRASTVVRDSAQDSVTRRAVVIAPSIITATRELQRRSESSATIDVVNGADIQQARPVHPAKIMNRIAGVLVSELVAEGHSTAIRQPITTKPMYLYLEDGVPTRPTGFFNHNALYEVNIPQSGGIEVLKGPGTALYGSDAIGGVVNVLTRSAPARPTLEMTLEGGNNQYRRLLTSGGFRTHRHAVRADLNLTRSDGWRDATSFTRQSGTVRWDYATASGWFIKTVGTMTAVEQSDARSIPVDMFSEQSTGNLSPITYRSVRALRISSAIEKDNGVTLWSVTPFVRHNTMGLMPSWQLSYDPQVWDTRNNSVGVLAKMRRDFEPWRSRVIAGFDVDHSPGHHTSNGITVTSEGTPRRYVAYEVGALHYDYDVTYFSASPYVHAETSPLSNLRFDAGMRYDIVRYTYDTKLDPLNTGAHRVPPDQSVAYRALSPKVGMTYDITPDFNVYASYRHGFRAPSQGQLFQQGSADNTVDLKPVQTNSLEMGTRGMLGSRVGYVVAVYDMQIMNDIVTYVTATNTREATNAGKTRHRGIETSLSVAVTADLRVDAAYSASRQRYVTWTPQVGVDYSGNRIEQAPRTLANVFASYTPRYVTGLRAALEWVAVGRYDMDPQNTQAYLGYRIMHTQLSYQVQPAVELFGRINNLTNQTYAEVSSYDAFQGRQFNPGAPRTVYLGMRFLVTR